MIVVVLLSDIPYALIFFVSIISNAHTQLSNEYSIILYRLLLLSGTNPKYSNILGLSKISSKNKNEPDVISCLHIVNLLLSYTIVNKSSPPNLQCIIKHFLSIVPLYFSTLDI